MKYEEVTPALLARVPEFEPFFTELLESFGDENGIGSHVVIGGLFTFLKDQLRASSMPPPLLGKTLDYIEELAASRDAEVQNLVVISFLEHLWQLTKDEQSVVIGRLGPATRWFLRQHNLP